MTRQQQQLPVNAHLKIPVELYNLVFSSHEFLVSDHNTFLNNCTRTYRLSSYSELDKKTKVKYKCTTQIMTINLYYCVRNPEGILQWPL